MLSQINISNLDNSISNTSVYSDAFQNSIELEEHFLKKSGLNNVELKNQNNEEKLNNDIQKNNISNKKDNNNNLSNSVNSELFESFSEVASNLDIKNNIKEENKNIYESESKKNNKKILNEKIIGKNESIDILNYKNDNLRIIYDNKNEKIDLNNKNSINEIINNKNINNVNLSNINIIINRGDNYYSRKNKKEDSNNNLSSIQEKNKNGNNSVNNSKLSKHSINNDLKSPIKNEEKSNSKININENNIDNRSLNISNKNDNKDESINNSINDNDSQELNKNLNINELTEINNNKEKNKKNENDKLNNRGPRKSNSNSLSINLENKLLNELDNVTIITKKKKKRKDNLNESSFNDNSSFLSFTNSLLVNSVKFDGIGNNEIDLEFLKSLRTIPIKYKKKNQKKYLKTLLELQNFYIDDSDIRGLKRSEDGQYLATGMSSGKIKLFEIIGYDYNKFENSYDKKNALNYLNFINEKPFKILNGHTQDIIDISWSSFFFNLLLSGSLDNVILWDITSSEEKCRIESFEHTKMVTCISFSPTDKFKFVTGCLDKFVRIWDFRDILELSYNNSNNNINNNTNININNDNQSEDKNINVQNSIHLNKLKKYNILYFNIEEKITAISYFPSGDKIAIGTHNGKIIIYEIKANKFYYKSCFSCKNRIGKNSFGKKITSIEFFNKKDAVISSCDSRIRLISMNDGKIIHKYKGYLNENSMIRSCIDYNYDIIITGSDDGFCYVWNIHSDEKKNLNYEYFKPYTKDIIHCSIIVPEKCYCNFLKKIMKITDKLIVCSIIINASDKGRLEVLLNIDEK